MNSQFVILVACFAALVAVNQTTEACIPKFKRAADFENYSKSCFTKSGFAKLPTHEEIRKPGFDDKCATKCIMGAIDIIDDSGRIDKDALSDYLQENVSPQTLLKLNEISTACVDSSGADKVQGSKQGQTPGECSAILQFYTCFSAAADKLC